MLIFSDKSLVHSTRCYTSSGHPLPINVNEKNSSSARQTNLNQADTAILVKVKALLKNGFIGCPTNG
jgi:hypothetical protein